MAQVAGQRYSYSGASYDINPLVPGKRSIADLIDMIDPREVPLLKYLGIGAKGAGGSKVAKFRIKNWPATKYQWLEDSLAPLTTYFTATVDTAASTDTTAVVVGTANMLRVGDVLEAGTEIVRVSAVDSASATVSRVYGGTTNTVATADTVEIIGRAIVEGADSVEDSTTQIDDKYNYTQIWTAEIKVSRSQNAVESYGMGAEYNYQVEKKFAEQLRLLEKTLYHGPRNAGSSTTARSMGGMTTFITDNTASLSSAPLTQKDLEDKIQACWEDGGMPDLIICNGWVKRKISSFYAGSVRTRRDEKRGGVIITDIDTEFGSLGILMDRWCPSDELYIVQSDYLGVLPFAPFFDEPLAKDGDYEKGHIVGEYGFVVKNDKSHALLTGISTSS